MSEGRMSKWHEAKAHFDAQRWREAEAVCSEILASDPDDADALFLRGSTRINTPNAKGAADDLAKVIARDPGRINAHFNLGLALIKLGRYQEALAGFETYLASDPNDELANKKRALCKAQLGEVEIRDGVLVAPPSSLTLVPADLRVEQSFGWGVPTLGATLVCGAMYVLGTGRYKPESATVVLAVMGAMFVVGALVLFFHLRSRDRRVVLVPTASGAAIYRHGKLLMENSPKNFVSYAHRVFNTLYSAVFLGLAVWATAKVYDSEPGVVIILLPIILMLASDVWSRVAFTHMYVINGESTAMFHKGRYARFFGDVQRWA